ncbi:MAG: metal-dependent hydrolase [Planctomycetales bacterium]|nr:metal-dependent hydrolase [Planctomycetales bacterium]
MADFKTHMTVSTGCGAALAFAGYQAGMHWTTCALAGGLCSVSGMLPDLDSDSGRPLREATTLAAAVVPMLMVERMEKLQLSHEVMVLVAAGIYLTIRFVIAELFRRYTVHRGMWHSMPAALTVAMAAFLIMQTEDISARLFKTAGVFLGFLSHLILDEIWSVDYRRGSYAFKRSFGTAFKLWGNDRWANMATYLQLAIIGFLVYHDSGFMERFGIQHEHPDVPHTAQELFQVIKERSQSWRR